MEIKQTPWEKRNLGVKSSVEFYFESQDNVDNININYLSNNEYSYQVAHVPMGKVDIVNYLICNGFMYAETKIELTADLRNLNLPQKFKRFIEPLSYHLANTSEQENMLEKIRGGDI